MAYEALHFTKTRKKGHNGNMAIKLDISKEYDRLEWSFLEVMMRKLGFNEAWIARIMCFYSLICSLG